MTGNIYAENGRIALLEPDGVDRQLLKKAFENWIPANANEKLEDSFFSNAIRENDLLLIIFSKSDDDVCGYCSLNNIVSRTPEIGINLRVQFQNRGIGKEALSLIMDTARTFEPIEYYIAKVRSVNLNSQRLMEKLNGVVIREEEDRIGTMLQKMQIAVGNGLLVDSSPVTKELVYMLK